MPCPNCGRANTCPLQFTSLDSSTPEFHTRGLNGIFNVNKPAGKTSHDIVGRVRRASKGAKVGHAGTLDPMATGVLLVCIGQGVRVSEYLMDHDKKYRARIRLGIATDTEDATGQVIAQKDVNVSREQVETALKKFVGKQAQYPPAYSAIKRDGVPLYKRARRGEQIETEPRNVEMYSITLVALDLPEVEVDVHCSKGTYIRSLARDVGNALDCGAHLAGLTRTMSGNFSLDDSVTLDELTSTLEAGYGERYLHPLDEALLHFEAIIVNAELEKQIQQGKTLDCGRAYSTPLLRAYSTTGECIALLERGHVPDSWKPRKVFMI